MLFEWPRFPRDFCPEAQDAGATFILPGVSMERNTVLLGDALAVLRGGNDRRQA
jgi:hypothetical protein